GHVVQRAGSWRRIVRRRQWNAQTLQQSALAQGLRDEASAKPLRGGVGEGQAEAESIALAAAKGHRAGSRREACAVVADRELHDAMVDPHAEIDVGTPGRE